MKAYELIFVHSHVILNENSCPALFLRFGHDRFENGSSFNPYFLVSLVF
jgi:hypothetical protein